MYNYKKNNKTYPEFIRISQDTIVNANAILEINRYNTTSAFNEWLNKYDAGLNEYIKENCSEYIKEYCYDNGISVYGYELSDEELKKINKKIEQEYKKIYAKEIGEKPPLYGYTYYIVLSSNATIQISEKSFLELCKIYELDPNKIVTVPQKNVLEGDESIDENIEDEQINNLYGDII